MNRTFFIIVNRATILYETKINIVVDLSSVDNIDTRQFLFNRTIVEVAFRCATVSFNSLKVIMF